MWMVYRTIVWGASLFAAIVLVIVATGLVAIWRSPSSGRRRRDGRWLLSWLILLPTSLAILHCEAGGYHSFTDPLGGDWNFDGYGWPLTVPQEAFVSNSASSAVRAICCVSSAVDLGVTLLLLAAVRLVIDRYFAAWDCRTCWQAIGREAIGCCVALVLVLVCQRLAARPITLPGTEIIAYTTLLYDPPEVRAGVLIGVVSAVYLLGLGVVRGARTLKRLRDEGVL
jgi:hypothetical protein